MSWKDKLKSLLIASRADSRSSDAEVRSSGKFRSTQSGGGSRAQKRDKGLGSFPGLEYTAWRETQFKDTSGLNKKIRLIIGLDFGTSYTKVVLGESRIRYAVPCRSGSVNDDDYLIPAILSVDAEGVCEVRGNGDVSRLLTSLKIPLLEGRATKEQKEFVVAYLSIVLRHVRGWFMNAKSEIYKNFEIDWLINVGLPTQNALDEEFLEQYRELVHAAWDLSINPGVITLRGASLALEERSRPSSLDRKGSLHPDAVWAFPEFAAGVAGYVRSPAKDDGLHAMIDIGAGTLDVVLFNIIDDEGDYRYPIFTKSVRPLGTHYLIQHRIAQSGVNSWVWRPQDKVPSNSHVCEKLALSEDQLDEVDAPFRSNVRTVVSEQFSYTKVKRYPSSDKWQAGLPVFVSGGGANTEFFTEALGKVLSKTDAWYAIKAKNPLPGDLAGINENVWSRLSVAYGLSLDPFDIGELVSPGNIEDQDINKEKANKYKKRYIGKDMV